MLTKDALDLLLAQGAANVSKAALPAHKILVPEGHRLHSIEKLLDQPYRHRFEVITSNLEHFGTYCNEPANQPLIGERMCFIDDKGMTADMVFNLGDKDAPGFGDHRAILRLRKTPEFEELLSVVDRPSNQREFAEWLEDWSEYLTPQIISIPEQPMTMARAIAAVRNVDIEYIRKGSHQVSDFSAEKTDLEKLDARGAAETLPNIFLFKCQPYEHLDDRTFPLRLSLTTTGDKPHFILRVVRLPEINDEITSEFVAKVQAATNKAKTIVGKLALPW